MLFLVYIFSPGTNVPYGIGYKFIIFKLDREMSKYDIVGDI